MFTRVDFAEQTGAFAVSEADVSFSVQAARIPVVPSLSAALESEFNAVDFGVETIFFAVPEVGLSADIHTVHFSVAVTSSGLVLVQRLLQVPYLTAVMLFRLLVPYLDSFKIVCFGLWPDDFTAFVCSDSFSIRPRGGVSASEPSVCVNELLLRHTLFHAETTTVMMQLKKFMSSSGTRTICV